MSRKRYFIYIEVEQQASQQIRNDIEDDEMDGITSVQTKIVYCCIHFFVARNLLVDVCGKNAGKYLICHIYDRFACVGGIIIIEWLRRDTIAHR